MYGIEMQNKHRFGYDGCSFYQKIIRSAHMNENQGKSVKWCESSEEQGVLKSVSSIAKCDKPEGT